MEYSKEFIFNVLYYVYNNYQVEDIKQIFNISEELIQEFKEKYLAEYIKCNGLSKRIKNLYYQNKFEQAKTLALKKEYQDISVIQSQYIKILLKEKKIEEALKVCERKEFANSPTIKLYQATIFEQLKDYKNYEEILRNPNFRTSNIIQAKVAKLLVSKETSDEKIRQKNIEEAQKIWNNHLFINDSVVQLSQIVYLTDKKDYFKALNICNKKEFENKPQIKLQQIIILKKLHLVNDALKICHKEAFKNNVMIQIQHLKLLLDLKDYSNIAKIIANPNLKNDMYFQNFIASLERKNIDLQPMSMVPTDKMLEQIKNNQASLENINVIEDDFLKMIYLLMYYDKNKYPETLILKTLKVLIKEYALEEDKILIIKSLKKHLSKKRSIFDSQFYQDLIEVYHKKEEQIRKAR